MFYVDSNPTEELLELVGNYEQTIEKDKKITEEKQRDLFGSVQSFSGAIALIFSQIVGNSQQSDIYFAFRVICYILGILICYIVRDFILEKEDYIRKYSGPFLYEISIELINFIILLFIYVLTTIIRNFVSFSESDIPNIVIIYLFYLLLSKIYAYATKSKKIDIKA